MSKLVEPTAPAERSLPVPADVLRRLAGYRAAAASVDEQASAYVAGLAAGLGFDPQQLAGWDDERGVLLLRG